MFFSFVILVWAVSSFTVNASDHVIYVNHAAGGTGTGESWENAFTNLQDAIDIAEDGDEIWVAEGTYYPSAPVNPEDDNELFKSFLLKSNIDIYGGFAGSEMDRSARNISANETILNGVISAESNVFHVVYGEEISNTVLDGFLITGGKALTNSIYESYGGGIHLSHSEGVTLQNLIIVDNEAHYGGGVYLEETMADFINVTIRSNSVTNDGGGIAIRESMANFLNSRILSNSADNGGGIFSFYASLSMNNSLISNNYAEYEGAGIYEIYYSMLATSEDQAMEVDNQFYPGINLSNVTVTDNQLGEEGTVGAGISVTPIIGQSKYNLFNSIVWGNGDNSLDDNIFVQLELYTVTQENQIQSTLPLDQHGFSTSIVGGISGSDYYPYFAPFGIIDADPLFNGNYQLLNGSPAIDQGKNEFVIGGYDLAGNTRIQNGTVDMGAFESQSQPDPITIESVQDAVVEVPFSTTYDNITLPDKVLATLSNGETVEIAVDWESFADEYDPTALSPYYSDGILQLSEGITNPNEVEPNLEVIIIDNYIIQVGVEREVSGGATYIIEGTKSIIKMPSNLKSGTRILVDAVDVDSLNKGKLVQAGDVFKITVNEPIMVAGTMSVSNEEDFILTLGYDEEVDPDSIQIYYYNEKTNSLEGKGGTVDKTNKTIAIPVTHFSIYGVFHEPVEEEPVVEEPKEEEPKVDKGEDGKKLPDTATGFFNWLAIGIGLIVLGGITFLLNKRREAKE